MMRTRLSGVASLVILVALVATGMATPATPPRAANVDVHTTETILTFPARDAGADPGEEPLGALVALPRNATQATASMVSGQGQVEVVGEIMKQRGRPVALVQINAPGEGPLVVSVRYDGQWHGKADDRLASAVLDASVPGARGPAGLKAASDHPAGGSYVVITAPQYAAAMAPLAAWKTAKGWPVVLATTDEVGTTNEGIRTWLQNAYESWDTPPEYVLLVGDVDAIPSWSFSGNVTDLPYSLLDGDDWLPDVMLGRFSVSNQSECEAMVAKTVAYEQTPYTDEDHWFTRSVMVAGQYASTTPMHTVRFCGEQLASIGFDPMDPVTPIYHDGNYIVSPYIAQDGIGIPQNLGIPVIKQAIDTGCSMVVYRGWAYGTAGWEPPHYTVDEIPSLANGAMTPVVMSFVCLNGDFSAANACFGEVFTRTGGSTPDEFQGAVAFIGNGEHWSHTRFNDAMAIGFFERAVDPGITTLGGLLNAGKMRFMEYYPGELDDTGDEESVEFYFHIYNLLGDPELNYYRARPQAMTVTHAASLDVGTTYAEVTAAGEAGARVGISQGGVLLGRAMTGTDGIAHVVLETPVVEGPVVITVSKNDRIPYQAMVNGDAQDTFVALNALNLSGDYPSPSVATAFTPQFINRGTLASATADIALSMDGPVVVSGASATLDGLAAGAVGTASSGLQFRIDADAEDGALVTGELTASYGAESDRSGFQFQVIAPHIELAPGLGTALQPGVTGTIEIMVSNTGAGATAGGDVSLSVVSPEGVSLTTGTLNFGAVASGAMVSAGNLELTVDGDVAEGQSVILSAQVNCDDGAQQARSLALPVGNGAMSEPAGPDAHGYYAYDSADYLYPGQRPVYQWRELSTQFGGAGEKLPFQNDNYDTDIAVDLPFTFTYYGQDFDRIRVSDNGWVSFDDQDDFYNFYNWPLPSVHGNGAVVAPFWDNLDPEPMDDPASDPVGVSSDGVYYLHDEATDEFIIEWSRMRHVKPEITDLQTFQLVLRDPAVYGTPTGDGEMLFFYKQVADNDELRMFASVGMESPDETDGLQLTYDGVRGAGTMAFGPGQAIRVTTAAPERQPLPVTAGRVVRGGRTELSWTFTGQQPVLGWQVLRLEAGQKTLVTPEPLAADARQAVLDGTEGDLVLMALLPHGVSLEAARVTSVSTSARFALSAPVPNPMRGETSIAFALPRAGQVSLRVFDVRGRLVRTLVNGDAAAGEGMVVWQGRDDRGHQLADGVYFCRLEHEAGTLTQKLLLVR